MNKRKEAIKMALAFNHLMITVNDLTLTPKPSFQDLNEYYEISKEVVEMEKLIELVETCNGN